jgi:hypothetical protein
MENTIQIAIDSRKDSLYSTYNLTEEAKKEAEAVFRKMEEFAKTCTTHAEFEERLPSSEVNQEYNNLFVKYAKYAKRPEGTPTMSEIRKQAAKDHVKSTVRHHAEVEARGAIFRMMPDNMQKWWLYGIYNVPILGNIITALNTADTIKRLFGIRKKDK